MFQLKLFIRGYEPGLLYYWRFDEGGKSLVTSSASDAYGILGGGELDAEPRYIYQLLCNNMTYCSIQMGGIRFGSSFLSFELHKKKLTSEL